jgi:hypothetical protein
MNLKSAVEGPFFREIVEIRNSVECNVAVRGGDRQNILPWKEFATQQATSLINPRDHKLAKHCNRIKPIQLT